MSLLGSMKSSITKATTSARIFNSILNNQYRNLHYNINKSKVLLSPKIYNNAALSNVIIRQVQTAGDTEIATFLNEEITTETKQEKSIPSVRGFKLTKQEGANVTLERSSDDEVVSVTLNVNNSVADEPSLDEQQNDKEVEMVSRPPFLVEIRKKSGGQTLAIQCIFPSPDTTMDQTQDQQYDDAIEIQDVTFLGKDQEWGDFDYSVQGSIMDGNLYAMMLTMLEERGIDGNFVEDLIDFSTTYEHKQYVTFLKSLKTFVSK